MQNNYNVSGSWIDENNDSVSRSGTVFRHGNEVKITYAAEFFAAEDLT